MLQPYLKIEIKVTQSNHALSLQMIYILICLNLLLDMVL